MTATTAMSLTESQQLLIDARLDTIDRMLMGRISRADRIAIVREVESQVHELLGDRDPQSITCEEVLDVLRRLDPPEAYLSTEVDASQSARKSHPIDRPLPTAKSPAWREGRVGGMAGLSSLGLILMMPLLFILSELFDSPEIFQIGFAIMALLGIAVGVSGLILSIRGRRQGILPIFGIVTASVALPIWLICPVLMLLAS